MRATKTRLAKNKARLKKIKIKLPARPVKGAYGCYIKLDDKKGLKFFRNFYDEGEFFSSLQEARNGNIFDDARREFLRLKRAYKLTKLFPKPYELVAVEIATKRGTEYTFGIVMEHIAGKPLLALEKSMDLDLEHVKSKADAAMLELGIDHGDLNSNNVMMVPYRDGYKLRVIDAGFLYFRKLSKKQRSKNPKIYMSHEA